MELSMNKRKGVWRTLIDMLSYTEEFKVIMAGDIVDRTKLLCIYIEEETGESFDLGAFILILFRDFLNYSVKNPLPSRILSEISTKPLKEEKDEYIKIVCNGVTSYEKPFNSTERINRKRVVKVKMDKREAQKGKIILDEIYFSQGISISMEELLSSLWTNFIVDYREGNNKRAYKSIVKILKQLNLN